jgi:hypothetical protein
MNMRRVFGAYLVGRFFTAVASDRDDAAVAIMRQAEVSGVQIPQKTAEGLKYFPVRPCDVRAFAVGVPL